MKRLSIPLKLVAVLLVISLFAACTPGQPTPSAEEIAGQVATSVAMTIEAQGQIATSVAMTVAAQEAEAAAAMPSPVPSPTVLPTITPILPTATPFTVSGGSSSSGGSGGSGGTTSYEYSCDIIRQRPQDNTQYHRKDTFDVSFAIKNTGTKTWVAGKDLTLLGNPGPTLTSPPGTIQLPEVKPGDVFSVGPFDAEAPDTPGHYVIDFKLEGGFCYPYVAFDVIR